MRRPGGEQETRKKPDGHVMGDGGAEEAKEGRWRKLCAAALIVNPQPLLLLPGLLGFQDSSWSVAPGHPASPQWKRGRTARVKGPLIMRRPGGEQETRRRNHLPQRH
jgi:hypothetical protein